MNPDVKRDADGEYQLISIDEWKRLYGTPGDGTGLDVNGRVLGYFTTEPDFCEDADEVAT